MRRIVVTLSVIAFALVAVTGFAKAPSFSSLPDVVISDYEKNAAGSFTTDFNFFEYLNAFDILTYASDEDSVEETDLKFVFTEDPPDFGDLSINGALQLDQSLYDPTDPSTWPAGALMIPGGQGAGGDFTVSIRDLVRSSGTGEGPFADPVFEEGGAPVTSTEAGIYLPWHDASGQLVRVPTDMPERPVTIWAGDDDDNAGSGTMIVYSVNSDENGPMDSLMNVIATIFTDDLTNWTTETAGGLPTANPVQNSVLSLTGTAGQFNFTRWKIMTQEEKTGGYSQAPVGANIYWVPIEYVDDDSLIYAARYTIQHNQASRATVPTMRLGISDALQYQAIMNRVGTIPGATQGQNSQWPDQNTDKVFDVVWANNVGTGKDSLDLGANGGDMRNYKAFFDLLNRNATGVGTLTLGAFEVVTLPRPGSSSPTDVPVADFAIEGTAVGGATRAIVGSDLRLTTPASGATVPYILTLNTDVIQMQEDSLVRLTVALSCPTDADRTNFHNMRIRHDTPYQNQDGLYFITQLNSGLAGTVGLPGLPVSQQTSPGATTDYEVYVPVFVDDLTELSAAPAPAPRTTSDSFGLGLDYIGAIPGSGPASTNASTVAVNSVTYEVLNMPAGL